MHRFKVSYVLDPTHCFSRVTTQKLHILKSCGFVTIQMLVLQRNIIQMEQMHKIMNNFPFTRMFRFSTPIITHVIQEMSRSLSTKVSWNLYNLVKIRRIMITNVSIFSIYESSFQNVIKISSTIYHNKTKVPGKSSKFWVQL